MRFFSRPSPDRGEQGHVSARSSGIVPRGGPLATLYEQSLRSESHVQDYLPSLRAFEALRLQLLRVHTEPRCKDVELYRRIESVSIFAAALSNDHACVHGVALFGSALRGKETPQDVDLAVFIDASLRPYAAWSAARAGYEALARRLFPTREGASEASQICGLPLHVTLEKTAASAADGLIPLVGNGPFIVFARPEQAGAPPIVFSNPGSKDFREATK